MKFPKTDAEKKLAPQLRQAVEDRIDDGSEILVAELGEKPFESFVESDFGLVAYIRKDLWADGMLNDLYIMQSPEFTISYTVEEIEQVNWNEQWEKHFEPIDVDGRCHVRAPFHPATGAEWRLASYDSALLQLLERPQVMPGSREGTYELVARFRARVPGETEVYFERTRPVAGEANDRKFTISIHSRY